MNQASRRNISRTPSSPIEDAYRRELPPCRKCGALKGDPCRTPKNKVTRPHKQREMDWGLQWLGQDL